MEEFGNDGFVFLRCNGAGGVDELAAGFEGFEEAGEKLELAAAKVFDAGRAPLLKMGTATIDVFFRTAWSVEEDFVEDLGKGVVEILG